MFKNFNRNLAAFRVNVPAAFGALNTVGPAISTAWARLTTPGLILVILVLLIAVGAGLLAEWLVKRAGRRNRQALLDKIRGDSPGDPLSACAYLAILEGIGIIVFLIVSSVVFVGWMSEEPGPITFFRKFFAAAVVIRFSFVVGRMMFAPGKKRCGIRRSPTLGPGACTMPLS